MIKKIQYIILIIVFIPLMPLYAQQLRPEISKEEISRESPLVQYDIDIFVQYMKIFIKESNKPGFNKYRDEDRIINEFVRAKDITNVRLEMITQKIFVLILHFLDNPTVFDPLQVETPYYLKFTQDELILVATNLPALLHPMLEIRNKIYQ
jgi:hypothetical protein